MSQRWQQYRQAQEPLPGSQLAWPFSGAGLASLGVDGGPVAQPLPVCGPDDLLVRVDALGLCASDAKMVRLGRDYPLFAARDWAADPAQLGHEAALTVVTVGEHWQGQYRVGERLGIQPDVYQDGKRVIFGVNIAGAMAQYTLLDRRVLAGDGGSYIFRVPPQLSYADIALLEPWACVDVAYSPTARRLQLKEGGLLWIAGRAGDGRAYTLSRPLPSATLVLSDVPPAFAAALQSQGARVFVRNGATAAAIRQEFGTGSAAGTAVGIDDIILLNPPQATSVAAAVAALGDRGTLNLVLAQPLEAPAAVEMHKLHYGQVALLGCRGPDVAAAYGAAANRSDLRGGGLTWIVGAGGTMGRMHIQRALQMEDRPHAIIATNRGQARLDQLQRDFAAPAAAAGVELVAFSPSAQPARLAQEIERLGSGRGCDDIVVVVPDPAAVAAALPHLAHDGLLVVFAGVPAGPQLHLPLDWTALYGAQFTGSSGSGVTDQLRVLEKIERGMLDAAQTVAAVGGLAALQRCVQAVMEQRYAGKVLIFPQLVDLPLYSLAELADMLPAVYGRLGAGERWTAAAEQALFSAYWEGG